MSGGGAIHSYDLYGVIISLSNLFCAWNEFRRGKAKKQDVAEFSVDLEENIFNLHDKLSAGGYVHSMYSEFYVFDPKRRHIHKAKVVDRLLHHAIFRVLEPLYDKKFIFDSYSSRQRKGVHKARSRLHGFAWKLSRNNTRTVWILKCDIKKYFDSVDHEALMRILSKSIVDQMALRLLRNIVESFESKPGKGIPLGNLTSQLFSNVYLNEFDQFVKRDLRVKYYLRYADDFVVVSTDREELFALLPKFTDYLGDKLLLTMHPDKVKMGKFHQGVDFLGHVIFPFHQVLRTKTKIRMIKKVKEVQKGRVTEVISKEYFRQSLTSFRALLKHCKGKRLERRINQIVSDSTKHNRFF